MNGRQRRETWVRLGDEPDVELQPDPNGTDRRRELTWRGRDGIVHMNAPERATLHRWAGAALRATAPPDTRPGFERGRLSHLTVNVTVAHDSDLDDLAGHLTELARKALADAGQRVARLDVTVNSAWAEKP